MCGVWRVGIRDLWGWLSVGTMIYVGNEFTLLLHGPTAARGYNTCYEYVYV